MKIKKSKNFNKNLNGSRISKQVLKNTYAASEILKLASNKIAPIASGQLRSNVIPKKKPNGENVLWAQPYSGIRYVKNFKNPQTRYWIRKGYSNKKIVIQNRMKKDVIL